MLNIASPRNSLFIGLGISLFWFPCVKGNLPKKAEYGWWTGLTHARDGWKCWSTEGGALCVMTAGATRMQEWFVVSWDTTRESYFVPAPSCCIPLWFCFLVAFVCFRLGLRRLHPCFIYLTLFLVDEDDPNVSVLLSVLTRISDRTELVTRIIMCKGIGDITSW